MVAQDTGGVEELFMGKAQQVDRKRTMWWYNSPQDIADQEDYDSVSVEVSEARAQMGVLRTIFAGGLMTPDRALRHRKKQGEHVSWRK